ncbi:MAG: pur operon repressor [Hydrogenibacillus sp.]|nr:pur operon repressor [Hydrogenibacillus sp.]
MRASGRSRGERGLQNRRRRTTRLIDLTRRLTEAPYALFSLGAFAEDYGAAKSSISEDLAMIKAVLEAEGSGTVRTFAGAQGGVRFEPWMGPEAAEAFVLRLLQEIEQPERLLPGGFLYITDLLGRPDVLRPFGRLIATLYWDEAIDWIMTVETKGIPLAYAAAFWLGRPVAIARRDSQITEGSVVTINYVSGSGLRIQTMSLSRRTMPPGARVLLIDDFLRGGGTVRGLAELCREFQADVVDTVVLIESPASAPRLVDDYRSIIRLTALDDHGREIRAEAGGFRSALDAAYRRMRRYQSPERTHDEGGERR